MSEKINELYKNNNEIKQKISNKVKEAYERDPSIGIRKSETMKMNNRNCGNLNGMKKEESKLKVSMSRKKYFENYENRKKVSKKSAEAWKNGKFDGVKTGKCKWHKYNHSNGQIYKVQGTWELAFIKWLDINNLDFICHKKRISYIKDEIERSYYPDFWVNDWNSFVDVKCKEFYDEEKFNSIRECNPDINIKVLFDYDLINLGVEINEKTKDFKHLEC